MRGPLPWCNVGKKTSLRSSTRSKLTTAMRICGWWSTSTNSRTSNGMREMPTLGRSSIISFIVIVKDEENYQYVCGCLELQDRRNRWKKEGRPDSDPDFHWTRISQRVIQVIPDGTGREVEAHVARTPLLSPFRREEPVDGGDSEPYTLHSYRSTSTPFIG